MILISGNHHHSNIEALDLTATIIPNPSHPTMTELRVTLSLEDKRRTVLNYGLISSSEFHGSHENSLEDTPERIAIDNLQTLTHYHFKRKGSVQHEYYAKIVTVNDETPERDCHTDDWSKAESWSDRKRRNSFDVLTIDRYVESSSKNIPDTGNERREITIKYPLLDFSTPNASSEAIWFEDSACQVSEESFCRITQPGDWFDDEIITASFAILDRMLSCNKQRIALLDPWSANGLYKYQHEVGNLPLTDYMITEKCRDKDFIIIPISDGFSNMRETGIDDEKRRKLEDNMREEGYTEEMIASIMQSDVQYGDEEDKLGSHWSVLIVDCRGASLKGVYFDSFSPNGYKPSIEVAIDALEGLSKSLAHEQAGTYHQKPTFTIDQNAPNQGTDNACTADKNGACGAFVWAISKEFVQYIIECREDSVRQKKHIPIVIALPEGFKRRWQWDSSHTRRTIRNLIERECRVRMYLYNTHTWFDYMGIQGCKTALATRGLPEDWFWDPYQESSKFE
ncbi:uncharacterized protein K460DRAFT_356806 [Cucurbitaria berberidis CBS 394.84]|uniref:Ubiquitin-like protease family profile domain-containing protein n=1 Tax=Cucurbitaria berberidis CBS 394.84 TaxID=1168544 RepID=A0A9P4L6G1_9PLEO|nr:uncharacterized protein K460DRAFT_356806 [Cucurbitaria berberidis CBS 394.84]KAF1843023.1 hypothetical protein K460DRAFT_356806 [Cucurbitaria berberidis CBS 394.84]